MSHICDYTTGECPKCEDQVALETERLVRGMRGRWLVVDPGGAAVRYNRKRYAKAHVAAMAEIGERSRLIRYRRERAVYEYGSLYVTDARWLP